MILKRNLSKIFVSLLLCSFFISANAKADASLGDSALTVAFSTIGGAVLGASTLPFYEEPGDHTKNIFYGAALGAVVGVLISAYAGVKEGPAYEEEEAGIRAMRPTAVSLNDAPELRLKAEASSATRKPAGFGAGTPVYWSSIAKIRF